VTLISAQDTAAKLSFNKDFQLDSAIAIPVLTKQLISSACGTSAQHITPLLKHRPNHIGILLKKKYYEVLTYSISFLKCSISGILF